jgi:Domain of unknown function (DUF5666)
VTVGANLKVAGKRNSDGSITARKVEIVLPALHGYIHSISGNTLVVSGHTVLLAPNTQLFDLNTKLPVQASALKVGEELRVQGRRTPTAA